jgi:hypothetical protein
MYCVVTERRVQQCVCGSAGVCEGGARACRRQRWQRSSPYGALRSAHPHICRGSSRKVEALLSIMVVMPRCCCAPALLCFGASFPFLCCAVCVCVCVCALALWLRAQLTELEELPWSAVAVRKVRKALDDVAQELRAMPNRSAEVMWLSLVTKFKRYVPETVQ